MLDGPDVRSETTALGDRCALCGGCTVGLTDHTWRQSRPRVFQSLRFSCEASYNELPVKLKLIVYLASSPVRFLKDTVLT